MLLSFMRTIIACSSLSIVIPTTSMIYATNAIQVNEQTLFNKIKSSANIIDQNKVWTYDNKQFTNENDLNNYIIKSNKIESVMTTSNPEKILFDYQNHVLDNKKIYNSDFNNFKTVYRDAFGNTTENINAALKTYSNSGLVKIKYSYDHNKWFDTIEEAKNNYVNNVGIHKSLYYYINGRYYNVFNKHDQELLKNVLQEGYRVAANKFDKQKAVYGTKEQLKNIIKEQFRDVWCAPSGYDTLNYKNFMKYETHHHLSIACDNSDLMGYWMDGTYYRQNRLEIDDPTNEISGTVFSSRGSGWKYDIEWSNAYSKDKWTKPVHTSIHDYLFEFKPRNGHISGSKFFWDKVTVEEKFDSTISLYDTSTHNKILDHWESFKNITGYNEISSDTVNQAYNEWFNNFYDQEFLKFSNDQKTNQYGVSKDLLYDANGKQGYEHSLTESQEYYEKTIKPQILKGKTKKDSTGEITYQLQPDFYATKQQLDNYLFLTGNVDTRMMYTYLDIQDISSPDGLALTNNIYDAEIKELQLNDHVMFYRYYAYDVFGNYQTSGESETDVLQKLYNTINLQAKFINRQEIDSWHNQITSFNSIVEDGVYQIYRIYSITKKQQGLDPYIYFDSYHAALDAIKANINKETNITTSIVNVYHYVYFDKNHFAQNIIYSSDKELLTIIKNLLKN